LHDQCIDGAADGDNDAQQNKQFLHDTSIAYEGGSIKLEGGSTTPSVMLCRVHAPVAWNLLGLPPTDCIGMALI
jgi:hypothetical protein